MGFPCLQTYSTHTSVSTFNQRLYFYHPSIRDLASSHLSASRRSFIGFLPGLLHHHTGILDRKLFKSSQDSRCVRTLWSTYSPVALKGDARRSVHNSAAFYHPDSGLSSAKSKRPLTETCSHQHATNNSKLEWKMEGHRENLKRMLYQAAGSIHGDSDEMKNVLNVSFSSHNYDNVAMNDGTLVDSLTQKSSSNLHDILYETPQNVLAGRTKVNGMTTLKECSTGTKECSKKIPGLNTLSNSSIQCEPYTNGKKHNLDFSNTRPSGTARSHESTSKVMHTLTKTSCEVVDPQLHQRTKLLHIYNEVLVVDDISTAKTVVQMLMTKYRDLIHACDTEVSNIDVKQETPVNHGQMTCFSIYSGPIADFGKGKSCIWVDLLDGDDNIIMVFAPFFEDPSIKKVWHNYSFDYHIFENYGINVSGFHADTMHLARLWDSSRRRKGGYSLEALTGDSVVMDTINSVKINGTSIDSVISQKTKKTAGKISMKSIFGKKKLKKDGSEGKLVELAPVEIIQREERILFICYSALDSISTLKLYESMKRKLQKMDWIFEDKRTGNMYDFYEKYWLPFGNILVEMEAEGILVDRTHLSKIEKVAVMEQKVVADKFRNWASEYCPDARHMNVGSDTQIRQLFFGGLINPKNQDVSLPITKAFKVPNVDNVIEEGKKSPLKFRTITLTKIGDKMQAECFTKSGWPSVSGDALKSFAGNVSAHETILQEDEFQTNDIEKNSDDDAISEEGETGNPTFNFEDDKADSVYGTAYKAFGGGKKGRDACHAIAALREISSIDSLISNFILPLQGNHISGKDGRIHCSLNINTETGRLSARRPNLQNPPALEKDRYKIRKAFVAAPGNSLIVADYGQLELRILAHLTNCTSMLDAFKAGGDFHSRTAMNMYEYIRSDIEEGKVLLEWLPQPGEVKPPVPLLKDAYASERRKAKMLNFSIAYGKTANGLSRDWKVSIEEARGTLELWYKDRREVLKWQEEQKAKALEKQVVHTLLGRARNFPWVASDSKAVKNHNLRAAINAPVQGSAADVAMCAMLQIAKNDRLIELKWKLLLQVHDEVILEGPTESAEEAKAIVVECMSKPFDGHNMLKVDLAVDAKYAQSWYAAK